MFFAKGMKMKTNLQLILLSLFICSAVLANEAETEAEEANLHEEEEEEEVEAAYALLFPPFTLTIGVVVFYLLSRYIRALPYTAVMFLLGTLIGIATALSSNVTHISETAALWVNIDWEVLLLGFLPGLIFKDAFSQNVHLFVYALPQLLIFAFPLVLMGTTLGALVGYYIFPFGWSFAFSMTVGSILAATDPVAVAALLEELGAPPRLKVHIAGESLLNDGSAIVFFSIFSQMYFQELDIDGFGEEVDLKKGIAIFCQKALGGSAAGLFFGFGLMGILFLLNHRFSREENVVQVATITAVAYLNYYVSDFVWETSGVIATVVAGLTVRFLGIGLVNDLKLLEDFLTIVEHILNTVLFTLGGAIWGTVLALGEKSGVWAAREWGYLILLYVMLNLIRFVQFTLVYPLTVRIGIKTNMQETFFQIFGGLRGAVGIALAVALDKQVEIATGGLNETEGEIHTQQAFGMIGGIAFMTLIVNSVLAGPLLRKLGLSSSSEARVRIVKSFKIRYRSTLLKEYVRLLCQNRFRRVNFALVKFHIPILQDLTKTQLLQAVQSHKASTHPEEYTPPHLGGILPYLVDDLKGPHAEATIELEKQLLNDPALYERNARIAKRVKTRQARRGTGKLYSASNLRYMMEAEYLSTQELRVLFLSILRAVYQSQVIQGELSDAHILYVSINECLDLTTDVVSNGGALNDWETLYKIHQPLLNAADKIKNFVGMKKVYNNVGSVKKRGHLSLKIRADDMVVERSLSFMSAHKTAQHIFASELEDADSELSEAAKVVQAESRAQYALAEAALKDFDQKALVLSISHKFCKILLTQGILHVEKLVGTGLMKETEAEPLVEEIEEELDHLVSCDMAHHPGELETIEGQESDDSFSLGQDAIALGSMSPIEEAALEESKDAKTVSELPA